MLVGLTVRVRPARYIVARVCASSADAGKDVVAVVVRRALALRHRDACAPSAIWISDCSLRTLADMIALRVDAVGSVPARVVRALVDIHATVLGVSFVASLAHAPRRIAGSALRVDATWETVARI